MERNIYKIGKELFITNDEKIQEGDWCLHNGFLKKVLRIKYSGSIIVFNIGNGSIYGHEFEDAKKIILTTDQDLIKDNVQKIDNEFLQWFVKNPSCEKVDVIPLRKSSGYYDEKEVWHWDFLAYKIIIPKEESKQDLEKEMFELEEQLDIPSYLRWYNSKPKQETLEEIFDKIDDVKCRYSTEESQFWSHYRIGVLDGLEYNQKSMGWQKEKHYNEEDIINAVHSAELKDNRNYTKIYAGMKEYLDNLKTKNYEIRNKTT